MEAPAMSAPYRERAFPTTAYRVWATFHPQKDPPCRFTTLASVAYERRERAEALAKQRIDEELARCAYDISYAAAMIMFGRTIYNVIAEPTGKYPVVLGDDEEWTQPPPARAA
jgi:hypothetical protein